jgi:hypothetical protein
MMLNCRASWIVLSVLTATAGSGIAEAACIPIRTPQELSNIRNNLAGDFCLARNIDLGSIANWMPIGKYPDAFTGTLDGRGFALSRLKSRAPGTYGSVGLFGRIEGGTVKNLRILSVNLSGGEGTRGGALAASAVLATISNVHVTGVLSSTGRFGGLGGLVSYQSGGSILGSSAAVRVTCTDGDAGGLVGYQQHHSTTQRALIRGSFATGAITCTETDDSTVMKAGGLVAVSYGGDIQGSFATGAVSCRRARAPFCDQMAGGLVGSARQNTSQSIAGPHVRISDSHATGDVTNWSIAGGLVGETEGSIVRSFALGNIGGFIAGGLAALNDGMGISHSYAGGRVTAVRNEYNEYDGVGGLVAQGSGAVTESFAFGPVAGSPPPYNNDGLVGFTSASVLRSYWDTQTTKQAGSDGGAGRTTAQLHAQLPAGFSTAVWATTPGLTYPYHKSGTGFQGTLATIVKGAEPFSLLPISQLDPAQYGGPATYRDRASLSAAYTMIARAIGGTRKITALRGARIDQYWSTSTNSPAWTGPVTQHASLGALAGISPTQPLGDANVTGRLKLDQAVILRGAYKVGTATQTHWMLATAFTVDGSGRVTTIVANDPWTGRQVRISPSTKAVVSPAGFPLAGFKVNGYRPVSFLPPPAS